jgi:carbon monoxide dehydrogenase subunit G
VQLTDSIRIDASRERVFAALNDVEVLKQAIPGCESIEALSPSEFTATVSAKVGPLKARFTGNVILSDIVPPVSYTLSGEGKGGPAGHARVSSHVRLEEDGSATVLHYDVNADIGGKLAQLGGHLVEKTSHKLAQEFFQKFEEVLQRERAAAPAPAAAAPAPVPHTHGARWWLAAAALAVIVVAWLAL